MHNFIGRNINLPRVHIYVLNRSLPEDCTIVPREADERARLTLSISRDMTS